MVSCASVPTKPLKRPLISTHSIQDTCALVPHDPWCNDECDLNDKEIYIMSLKCANQLMQKKIELKLEKALVTDYQAQLKAEKESNKNKVPWYWIVVGVGAGLLLGGGIGIGISR